MALVIIVIALIFEFINGFHDTANAVATSIATRSLEPFQAITLSAIFNLLGAISGTAVAITIASGFTNPDLINENILLSALLAAIIWNLFTWYLAIPSSSSNAIIGGLIGAIIFQNNLMAVNYTTLIHKVLLPMVISPIIGFIIASILAVTITKLLQNNKSPRKVNNYIREMQVLSTIFLSFSHGANDAQKTMGIITLTLFNFHLINKIAVPTWVIFICAICMALGTLFGGVKVIKTLSTRVAKLTPISGFAAEISAATLLFINSKFGIPISTTHAVSGSIMGAGLSSTLSINWAVIRGMITAWVLTIPACMLLSSIIFYLLHIIN